MGLETAFQRLQANLLRLQEAVDALHTTVAEDCPRDDETMLVDRLEDAIVELDSKLDEASDGLRRVLRPPGLAGRGGAVRNTLLLAHRRTSEFARQYRDALVTYDNICRLRQLGRERGGEWAPWSGAVKEAIERCAAPLDAVDDAIRDCWQEGTDGMVIIGAMSQAPSRMQPAGSVAENSEE